MTCSGWVEDFIFASEFKAFETFEGGICMVIVVEVDQYGITINLHILEVGTLIEYAFKAVITVQSRISQTLTHLLFLRGMDLGELIGIYEIVGAYQYTVGDNLRGFVLLFTQ